MAPTAPPPRAPRSRPGRHRDRDRSWPGSTGQPAADAAMPTRTRRSPPPHDDRAPEGGPRTAAHPVAGTPPKRFPATYPAPAAAKHAPAFRTGQYARVHSPPADRAQPRGIGNLFDLFQRTACVLLTVRDGRRAEFIESVSGVWSPRTCYPAPLRRCLDVGAACCPALTVFEVDDGVMGYFLSGREAPG